MSEKWETVVMDARALLEPTAENLLQDISHNAGNRIGRREVSLKISSHLHSWVTEFIANWMFGRLEAYLRSGQRATLVDTMANDIDRRMHRMQHGITLSRLRDYRHVLEGRFNIHKGISSGIFAWDEDVEFSVEKIYDSIGAVSIDAIPEELQCMDDREILNVGDRAITEKQALDYIQKGIADGPTIEWVIFLCTTWLFHFAYDGWGGLWDMVNEHLYLMLPRPFRAYQHWEMVGHEYIDEEDGHDGHLNGSIEVCIFRGQQNNDDNDDVAEAETQLTTLVKNTRRARDKYVIENMPDLPPLPAIQLSRNFKRAKVEEDENEEPETKRRHKEGE